MQRSLPYIFILDLDGTIVGNVQYQVSRFSLLNSIRKHGLQTPPLREAPKAYYSEELLIRPGFLECIKMLRTNYPWCHIFIYTASERKWALQEVLWIEKATGIQFNRPIFTRSDCIIQSNGSVRKSLKKVLPRIFRVLSRQMTMTREEKEFIIRNQMLIIDDNAVYLDGQDRILLCDSYNFVYCEDILEGIDDTTLRHPMIRSEYQDLLKNGLVHPYALEDAHDKHAKKAKIYRWIAERCMMTFNSNRPYHQDNFWKKLRSLLLKNNVTRFTSSVVKQIQHAIYPDMKN
jgi:hypothetical protein